MQTYKELKLYSLGIFQYAVVVEVLRTLFTSFSVKAHKHANFETFEVFEMSKVIHYCYSTIKVVCKERI
jgi:hypothetical protein